MEAVTNHRICLDGRKNGIITGVHKVISFDTERAELNTDMGKLTIKGAELHMSKLDSDSCELEFTGRIDSMEYSEITEPGKVASKIFGRLFR